MPAFIGFSGGPSNTQQSRVTSAQRSLNLIPRVVDAGTNVGNPNSYSRPGLRLFTFLGAGAVTALFSNDGLQVFGVGGATFYELFPSGNVIARGAVRPSPVAASICSMGTQGHQVGVVSGGLGYIYDTISHAFTQITDDAFPTFCTQMLFYASSFVALSGTDGKIVVSAPLDGSTWNGLDSLIQTTTSDQTIAIARTKDNLFLYGQRNTIPMYNSGDGGAAGIVPVQGAVIEHGIAGPYCCVEVNGEQVWLSTSVNGSAIAVRANGYDPQIISSLSTSFTLSRVRDFSNVVASSYQEQGQTFVRFYVPGLDTTPELDISTGLWHDLDQWSTPYGRSFPFVGVNHCYAWGKHLVGDRQSGAVYEQSNAYFDDALVLT